MKRPFVIRYSGGEERFTMEDIEAHGFEAKFRDFAENLLAGFRSLPDWVEVVANVAYVAIIPVAILVAFRAWRSHREEPD